MSHASKETALSGEQGSAAIVAHTPGPWGKQSDLRDCMRIVAGPRHTKHPHRRVVVAEVPRTLKASSNSDVVGEDGGVQEQLANARLICAAPDLLAACVSLMKWIDKMEMPFTGGRALAFGGSLDEARAAIAKAEGR